MRGADRICVGAAHLEQIEDHGSSVVPNAIDDERGSTAQRDRTTAPAEWNGWMLRLRSSTDRLRIGL
jgi:hypothetical protein